jgi:YgiT-type zinc finger domain-containing protein
MKKRSRDRCEFCDGTMEERVIQARFHWKGQTIYVDRVPAWVCNKCGEQYFDASVYKRLEEIAKHRTEIKQTICFPLAEYDAFFA